MTLARALFDCQRQLDRLESVLYGALRDFYIRGQGWVKRVDHYDSSIEWWVAPGTELTEEEQAVLWQLGFLRCWLCESKDIANEAEEGNGVERFYCKPELLSGAEALPQEK